MDLLRQVPGQEPEALPGLHDRPRDDELSPRLAEHLLQRLGDGEVRLARPCRTDAEDELVPLDGLEVQGLVVGAGIDLAVPVGDDDEVPLEELRFLRSRRSASEPWRERMRSGPGKLSQAHVVLELLEQRA